MVRLDATAVPRIRNGCLERRLGARGLAPSRPRKTAPERPFLSFSMSIKPGPIQFGPPVMQIFDTEPVA